MISEIEKTKLRRLLHRRPLLEVMNRGTHQATMAERRELESKCSERVEFEHEGRSIYIAGILLMNDRYSEYEFTATENSRPIDDERLWSFLR